MPALLSASPAFKTYDAAQPVPWHVRDVRMPRREAGARRGGPVDGGFLGAGAVQRMADGLRRSLSATYIFSRWNWESIHRRLLTPGCLCHRQLLRGLRRPAIDWRPRPDATLWPSRSSPRVRPGQCTDHRPADRELPGGTDGPGPGD